MLRVRSEEAVGELGVGHPEQLAEQRTRVDLCPQSLSHERSRLLERPVQRLLNTRQLSAGAPVGQTETLREQLFVQELDIY